MELSAADLAFVKFVFTADQAVLEKDIADFYRNEHLAHLRAEIDYTHGFGSLHFVEPSDHPGTFLHVKLPWGAVPKLYLHSLQNEDSHWFTPAKPDDIDAKS